MRSGIKNFGGLMIFLGLGLLWNSNASAQQEERVEPEFRFYAVGGSRPTPNGGFSDVGAAFDDVKAEYARAAAAALPYECNIVFDGGPYRAPNSGSLNGIPDTFVANYRVAGRNCLPPENYGTYTTVATSSPECPKDFYPDAIRDSTGSGRMTCFRSKKSPDDSCTNPQSRRAPDGVGNPVLVGTAEKSQTEIDMVAPAIGEFQLSRTYRSQLGRWVWAHESSATNIVGSVTVAPPASSGPQVRGCLHGFTAQSNLPACFKFAMPTGKSGIVLVRSSTTSALFESIGGQLISQADAPEVITQMVDTNGINWIKVRRADNITEWYDSRGRLSKTEAPNGQFSNYIYDPTAPARLVSVVSNWGRSITFSYVQSSKTDQIASVTADSGEAVFYAYDALGRLATATYAGGTTTTYVYNEPSLTSGANLPYALTGIADGNGNRYASFGYSASGQAISTEYAGGVNRYTINGWGVTDPLGTVRQYSFNNILGTMRVSGISQPCSSCGGTSARSYTHDANANVVATIDFNNVQTTYTYDLTRNLETSRTEAVGKPEARTITTTWHPTYRLPATITEPAPGGTKTTTFTYDANGNLTQKSIAAPKNDGSAGNETRIWIWTYNALGQMLTAKDPLNRTTTYAYAAATDTAVPPKFTKGDLQTMTNSAGHVTTYNEYDKAGRLLKMTDANGLITTMTYHPRGWLTSRSIANGTSTETTTYTYDNVGQLTKVAMPDGSTIFYAYDAAHRLVGMSEQSTGAAPLVNGNLIITAANLSGDRIAYTLDNMGNRVKEEHFDSTGTVQKLRSRVINGLNQLQKEIGGTNPASQITQYTYDGNGNTLTSTDPLARVTTNAYDAFNRLLSMIDPVNGSAGATIYTYDAANNLTSVKDPKGLTTSYTYNGHNQLIGQTSPDTGVTKFAYDVVGNLTTKLDAAGRCTVNTYDALHRIKTIKYFASTAATNTAATCVSGTATAANETITYTYDDAAVANSKGRMTKFVDGTGNTAYTYDKNGRVLTKIQTTTGTTNTAKTIAYTYNDAGQLTSTVTPSGQTITYTYTQQNRITGIKVNGVDIVKGAVYEPFGPNGGWSWGNHGTLIAGSSVNQHQRVYDLDYRPIAIKSDPQGYTRNIQWDIANRIVGQTDGASVNPSAALSQTYGYDNLDRLTSFTPGAGAAVTPQLFTYDAIGNRMKLQATATGIASTGANTATYTYPGTSHRLQNITGNVTKGYTYDATGNTLAETLNGAANFTFTFDHKNRMRTVQIGATAADTVTYSINALGQRVRKLGAGAQATAAAALSKTARFVYDEQGRLLGEYDNAGKLIQETVWLNDLPVATIRPKGASASTPLGITGTGAATANNVGANTQANAVNVDFFYVHPDHLGTPRVVTKPADNKRMWEWQSQPFGETAANENPQNLTGAALTANQFRYNLRFPGQFYDAETSKHYNYFRDYDASIGRYVESDPIGLRGGVNTFGYVRQNTLSWVDPLGLATEVCFYFDAAGGYGHVGFGSGGGATYGFYPAGSDPFGGPGQVKRDRQKNQSCKDMDSNPDKDKCMENCRLRRQANPGKYNLITNQCTSFVRDCLRECGLGAPPGNGPLPKDFFDRLPGEAYPPISPTPFP
jgi:RHS repeat-associated protein